MSNNKDSAIKRFPSHRKNVEIFLANPPKDSPMVKGADKTSKTRHNTDREIFTIEEAADFLRVRRNSIYNLISSRELPSFKVGARRLIRKQAIIDFISNAEEGELYG